MGGRLVRRLLRRGGELMVAFGYIFEGMVIMCIVGLVRFLWQTR